MNRGIPEGGFEEIHLAARNRNIRDIRRLLDSGVNVNLRNRIESNGDGGNTPLWFACQGPNSQTTVVAELIKAGADVNAICEHGTTAAHMACSWGHDNLLKILYKSGADMSIQDVNGMTPEAVAKTGYDWQLVKVSNEQRAGVIAFFDALR